MKFDGWMRRGFGGSARVHAPALKYVQWNAGPIGPPCHAPRWSLTVETTQQRGADALMPAYPPVSRLVFALLMAGMVIGSTGCQHRTRQSGSPASQADTTDRPRPRHVSWDATFSMLEEGRRRAVLEAPRMEQYKTSDSTYSVWRSARDTSRVWAYLFNQEGDSSATLTADSVVFQDTAGRLDAYGNVVVVTESNKRLRTEHLVWHQADRTIRTRRFVRIVTPTEVVQGNGLVAAEDLETYQIGRFSAEVDVDEEDDGGG